MKQLFIGFIFLSLLEVHGANKYEFKSKIKAKIDKRTHNARLLGELHMTEKQCVKLAREQLTRMKKRIIPFTIGSRMQASDIYGAYSRDFTKGEYGQYAKLGMPDNHSYNVTKMQSQYAIHSDSRCYKYAKITKVDQTTYKGKLCRRIQFKISTLRYKTFFCIGDHRGYVDHFNLTKSI